MLEERIRKDLREATLGRDRDRADTLKMVLGEIPRLNKKAIETVSDEEIEAIIRKLIKSEKLVLEYSGATAGSSTYIRTLETYLPKAMTEKEIKQWILDNIDLSAYSNTVKAMGRVMKELTGKADGDIVRRALMSFQ
jgi:uncharacterized protein YqeY